MSIIKNLEKDIKKVIKKQDMKLIILFYKNQLDQI